MPHHAAFSLARLYGPAVAVKGSLRRASPALDRAHRTRLLSTPNPLRFQKRPFSEEALYLYNHEQNILFSLTPLMFWYRDEASNRREIDLYLFDTPKLKMNSIAFKSVLPREELSAVQGGDLDEPYRTILDMRQQDPVVPIYTNVAITRRNGP